MGVKLQLPEAKKFFWGVAVFGSQNFRTSLVAVVLMKNKTTFENLKAPKFVNCFSKLLKKFPWKCNCD